MTLSRKAKEFVKTVDFGVLTVREDELEPMARRCRDMAIRQHYVVGRQDYLLFDVVLGKSHELIYRLALVRILGPGGKEAQRCASNMIEDLNPNWLMLVGIAGATPSSEFTLGDVAVATELHDFSVRAAVFGKGAEYRPGGGAMASELGYFISLLSGRQHELGDWNEASNIGQRSPPVDVKRRNAIYGNREWRNKVSKAISRHFPTPESTRKPQIITRPFAAGNVLMKDHALWRQWQFHARQVEAVEMELDGMYTAARTRRRTYPILVSKGISDIIGFRRDDDWTKYACETAAAGALAMLALRPFEPREKPDLHAKDKSTKSAKLKWEAATNIAHSRRRTKSQSLAELRGGLLHEFYFKRNQMVINVHREYSLDLDSTLLKALTGLNALRQERGLMPYFASTLFRLISEPRFTESGIELDVAPMDFVYRLMLREKSVDDAVKAYARARIQETAQRIPKRMQSIHPTLNEFNISPLGVEILVVTKDGSVLLRTRGETARSSLKWDVSCSGYCGEADGGGLDMALTVQDIVQREIGALRADPREIVFTGIHRNEATEAVDVLSVWPTEARTEELVESLADKYPGLRRAFEATKESERDFVWDATNMIVRFDSAAISQAMTATFVEDGQPDSILAEAFACLLVGLKATRKSTTELAALLPQASNNG